MPAAGSRAPLLPTLAVTVVAALAGCSDEGDGEAAAPEATPATVQEGPVAATEVVVGDCLNGVVLGAAERSEISSADVVSCERAHALEVYATFELGPADFELEDPSEYPGPARVVRAADEGCAERFEERVGDRDRYGLIALWPSTTSWDAGDRSVACAVFSTDGELFERRQL